MEAFETVSDDPKTKVWVESVHDVKGGNTYYINGGRTFIFNYAAN